MTKLNKTDIARFKKKLEDLRRSITSKLEGTTQEVKTPDQATGYSQHQADQGTDDFDRTISLELTHSEFATLRQIDTALKKIDDGTYGICDITGEEIPMKRLEAIPYANMTVQAQEKLEKGLI
jgi:DnaK suppressor protein